MNKNVLIGFAAVLGIFLVLPIVMNALKEDSATTEPAAATTKAGPPEAPKWNASNLVGTAWSVKTPEIPIAVTITLNAGGQAVATVPAMFAPIARQQLGTDTIMGTWRVEGAKVIANVQVKDKTATVTCDIRGDKIFYQDKEIKRVS